MTTTTTTIRDLIPYVRQTRRYGHTYVHAHIRNGDVSNWEGCTGTLDGREVRITWEGYGRSLQSGGHKFKAHARFRDTQKPVPSNRLNDILP